MLNDPNEGVAVIDIKNQYRGWANQLEERNRRQKIRICAFTETHKNSVVWSHYADEHRGICIEFDSDKVDTKNGLLRQVNYSNTVPTLEHNSESDERTAFLNKTKEWAYEKEWRFIAKDALAYLQFSDTAITRVLLGARFSDSDLAWVKFWLYNYSKSRSISIVKMKFASTDYYLYEEGEMQGKAARFG
jgi:hypothetical protein